MKAVVVASFGPAHENAKIQSIDAPTAGADQAVIDVYAAGLNFADLLVIEGKYQRLVPPPFVPGREAAGTVRNVGVGATRLKAGDRVLAFVDSGAFAEQVVASDADCHVLPADLGFADAVSLGLNYQTAHIALTDRARLEAGESVLVTGASGGVGVACIQMAKAMGATVLAGIARPEKRLIVESAGADGVIDLAHGDPKNSIREQVYAAVGKDGVDVVLDTVGGDVFDGCLRAMAWRGRMVIIGFAAGRISSIMSNYLLVKNIASVGMYWDSYRMRQPDMIAATQQEIFALWAEGKIYPPMTQSFDLGSFAEAVNALTGRRTTGRVVIQTKV